MNIPIFLLQAVVFLDLFGVSLLIPLLSGHARKLGGNHIYVGLLGSIYSGFQLASGPFIGSLSDLKGSKTILIITILICSVAYILLGLTTSIIGILILRAVLGVFKQTQMLSKTLVPEYVKTQSDQSVMYGKMAAMSGIGISIGPIIGGHLLEDYPEFGFTIVALAGGMCFLVNAGLLYFLPKPRYQEREKKTRHTHYQGIIHSITSGTKQSFVAIYKVDWSKYWDIFLYKIFIGFAMSAYYSNYSIYMNTVFGLTPKYIGYVISFQGVIGTIASYLIGYINSFYTNDKNYSQRNFHVFLLLSASVLGLIMSNDTYLYVMWLIPLAIGNAIGRLVSLEMVLKRCHNEHRGTMLGVSHSVRSLTGILAPIVAGFVGQYYGVTHVIYASFIPLAVGAIMSYRYNKTKSKDD